MDVLLPEMYSTRVLDWWVSSQSDNGAMVLARESGYLLGAKVFASQRHQKISIFQRFSAPLPRSDIRPDGSVNL